MPKRLAIFCDGTWNDLRTPHLTNVARLAKCVKSVDAAGVQQIVYYDEGVGVAENFGFPIDKLVQWLGGGFGKGLDRKIEAAYRFLVLNYEPDDEIFVFGFSRGAYTARSLCGLIRKCGILRRDSFDKIPEALAMYRDKRHPNDATVVEFRQNYSNPRSAGKEDDRWVTAKLGPPRPPKSRDFMFVVDDSSDEGDLTNTDGDTATKAKQHRIIHAPESLRDQLHGVAITSYRMMYLGLWDTVGSLGIPEKFWFSRLFNRKYRFHDTRVSGLIASVRHAVAIEENRNVFDVGRIDNIPTLNAEWSMRTGGIWNVTEPDHHGFVPYIHRPYQQVWFPGDHGAVGGGNPEQGLSSAALLWVAAGAVEAGLMFHDDQRGELAIAAQVVNPMATWLIDKKGKPKTGDELSIYGVGGFAARKGPATVEEVSLTAKLRWCADPMWRPKNLHVMKLEPCPTREPFDPPETMSKPEGLPPKPSCYP